LHNRETLKDRLFRAYTDTDAPKVPLPVTPAFVVSLDYDLGEGTILRKRLFLAEDGGRWFFVVPVPQHLASNSLADSGTTGSRNYGVKPLTVNKEIEEKSSDQRRSIE
jgi:hypothetical protein